VYKNEYALLERSDMQIGLNRICNEN